MVIFVTNIWNHYTTNIGRHLAAILGEDNFRLVLVSPIEEETEYKSRKKMGWKFDLPDYKWIVPPPHYAKEFKGGEHVRLIETADVAVVGALYGTRVLFRAVRMRIHSGLLTFITNERFYKAYPSYLDVFNFRQTISRFRAHRKFSAVNVHYLPISHWGPEDMRFLDGCHNRVWKWTYTPEVSLSPIEKPRNKRMRVGWCGRMISWKHVEHIIQSMALLPNAYRDQCRVTLVGEGACKDDLMKLATELGLDACIEFLPYMPVAAVTKLMGELDVYVLPSDRGEGWGVVLAEAMDKCCVPMACVEAGATLDLIDDGENGFVFEKGDCRRIAKKLMWCIDHPDERRAMGLKAWKTMQERSPEEAAKRLCNLIKAIQTGDRSLIPAEGLCAPCGVK